MNYIDVMMCAYYAYDPSNVMWYFYDFFTEMYVLLIYCMTLLSCLYHGITCRQAN